ncbi:malonyl CoA-acyl carrier protein transacylase [Bartonella bacilliformis Peru38]|uniref:Malonyl CoA-acyl carrier protein transacylase n=2 Tax=Bartonella bacilliformis TaxID=774 RepID=A1US58_BARBK|nr:ACP S-malonyltransferase [Bartonella bacilliformis]ABM44454.1 malonyl CoA-acyl carrier protein transacylase [Bartonella bacilliformis KC583]AMG85644.1 [acyl-carrier-protein] S-malonyltransferase [Bartonella bacilliformis]EKS45061.1 malonyl CoA-acyl carrier protein transacylase [Bartonella bacilliformis INS]EYS90060.1 malonyl CoA-acyl carrier protein transacylase [Bartonella bacilliformis San Pedro600-02]EYS95037.1 malonyl CoA-acyl carrier protein transacylase [Bartonella bacilliformis Peru-
MVAAFTFPGQGSQVVGMGKMLTEQFVEARMVFEEVDDALGEKLSHIIFEGPEDLLTLTANAQPALMAVSLAIIRVMEKLGLNIESKVKFVAGHSLGEYSALCAANTFSLADTARLLRIRGNAMQEAVAVGEGLMAALIGLNEQEVEEICKAVVKEGICQIANDNGGGQIVISGEAKAVQAAVKIASEKGAKRAILLPVSAPFHSSLMQPAADAMKDALRIVNLAAPVIPLIANVSVAPENDPERILTLLVHQVTGQVRWRETIEWFGAHGVDMLFEIGSGKVLTGLARRINKDIKGLTIGTAEEIEEALKILGV